MTPNVYDNNGLSNVCDSNIVYVRVTFRCGCGHWAITRKWIYNQWTRGSVLEFYRHRVVNEIFSKSRTRYFPDWRKLRKFRWISGSQVTLCYNFTQWEVTVLTGVRLNHSTYAVNLWPSLCLSNLSNHIGPRLVLDIHGAQGWAQLNCIE
jgi:hypothetical protein